MQEKKPLNTYIHCPSIPFYFFTTTYCFYAYCFGEKRTIHLQKKRKEKWILEDKMAVFLVFVLIVLCVLSSVIPARIFMSADDPGPRSCRDYVQTDSVSPFLPALPSQICVWHVSLHLARTCLAFGYCIMALVRQHYNFTMACGKVTRLWQTKCLCKSIKKDQKMKW